MKLFLAVLALTSIACSEGKNLKEICGRAKVPSNTEDASTAKPENWPWHVLFHVNHTTDFYLEGTLISKNYVLAVAKYVVDGVLKPEHFSVVLNPGGSHSQEIEVEEIIVHDKYDAKKQEHNIALLKLKNEVEFNDYVQPACLWDSKVIKNGAASANSGTVVGYENYGDSTQILLTTPLRKHVMTLVSQATCKASKPSYSTLVTDDKFCAENTKDDKLCINPTGAPYQVFVPEDSSKTEANAPGAWYLKGLLQHMPFEPPKWECAPNGYFLFVDIEKHLDWIQSHIE